jgi:hypothetical protein
MFFKGTVHTILYIAVVLYGTTNIEPCPSSGSFLVTWATPSFYAGRSQAAEFHSFRSPQVGELCLPCPPYYIWPSAQYREFWLEMYSNYFADFLVSAPVDRTINKHCNKHLRRGVYKSKYDGTVFFLVLINFFGNKMLSGCLLREHIDRVPYIEDAL